MAQPAAYLCAGPAAVRGVTRSRHGAVNGCHEQRPPGQCEPHIPGAPALARSLLHSRHVGRWHCLVLGMKATESSGPEPTCPAAKLAQRAPAAWCASPATTQRPSPALLLALAHNPFILRALTAAGGGSCVDCSRAQQDSGGGATCGECLKDWVACQGCRRHAHVS